jgi:hypothetical protein
VLDEYLEHTSPSSNNRYFFYEYLKECLERGDYLDYLRFFEVLDEYLEHTSPSSNNRYYLDSLNIGNNFLSDFFWKKKPLLKEGKITYAIPSEMNLKQSYTCSIKIAFDLETLLKDIDLYENAYSEAENLLVSSKLRVDVYDVDSEFQIKWLCPQTQTLVKEKASEWVFSVKPLKSGGNCLYFCVSAFLENGEDNPPHVKVFSKKITVKVNNSFMPSSLLPTVDIKDFEPLVDKSIHSSVKEVIDEIVGMINEVQIYEAFKKVDEVMRGKTHPHIETLKQGYIHGDTKFDFYGRFKTCVWVVLSETLTTA